MRARGEPGESVGLCRHCRYVEPVRTSRDTTFYLCGLSRTDARFPKYPALPVVQCSGFEPAPARPRER